MAPIQQSTASRGTNASLTLAERVRDLEAKRTFAEQSLESEKTTKEFKWPFKWRRRFSQSKRKSNSEMILVMFYNKKNEIEIPRFMPIFDGNLIVWKNKPYEFDPRAIWRVKGVKGNPIVYCIKEIDRRPIKNADGTFKRDSLGRKIYGTDASINNLDIEEIRARGDSTESDEFLIKAALRAQVQQGKKNMNMIIIILVICALVGGVIWFLTSGSGAKPA